MPASAAPAASASSPHAVLRPQLRRALAREVAQAALGLGGGDLREHVGFVDLLDRESAHADVAIGPSNLNEDGSVVRGQGPTASVRTRTSLWRYLGRKRSAIPMGRGANLFVKAEPKHYRGQGRQLPDDVDQPEVARREYAACTPSSRERGVVAASGRCRRARPAMSLPPRARRARRAPPPRARRASPTAPRGRSRRRPPGPRSAAIAAGSSRMPA